MIDTRAALKVLKDENGVFKDLSLDAGDYLSDAFEFDLGSDDSLYLGLHKPFGTVFVEMHSPAAQDVELSVEIFDGSQWQVVKATDETRGLTRSGFISWDKAGMVETPVDGTERFYVRLTAAQEVSDTAIRGINIVFTSMSRLKKEFFEVDSPQLLPTGESSHIGTIVASRDQLVQQLRNMGYQKTVSSAREMINAFDLIDIYEVREASTFLVLSKLFFNLSSSPDDHWWSKYLVYNDKYAKMMRLAHLSIDKNGDGVDDKSEVQAPIKVQRWNR